MSIENFSILVCTEINGDAYSFELQKHGVSGCGNRLHNQDWKNVAFALILVVLLSTSKNINDDVTI